jgi:UDP-N-acetylmuramate--alanine ligase
MPANGKVIVNKDCNGIKQLINANPDKKFMTFGIESGGVDYSARNLKFSEFGSEFDVYYRGQKIVSLKLNVPGKHNIYNALSVISALNVLGVDLEKVRPHFATFSGMGRRFQKVAEVDGIRIFDDYAHHPTEIKTTLDSARLCDTKRLVAIFQPHRYSRLKGLWDDFLKCFGAVDKLIVVDVYSASEDAIEGINSKAFAACFKTEDVTYIGGSMENASRKILPLLKSGDLVVTLGAGDVTRIGQEIIKIHENTKIDC